MWSYVRTISVLKIADLRNTAGWRTPHLEGGAYERLMFCRYITKGSSLQTKYLHDLSVALDVLCAIDGVDEERIGAIGHSLGGQETLWLTWYDDRIRATVASCGFSQIRSIFSEGINHNFAMFVPRFLSTVDTADLVCDLAPRPFLMTHGTEDVIFPIEGVRDIAAAAAVAYEAAGHPERFQSIVFAGVTAFRPMSRRLHTTGWISTFTCRQIDYKGTVYENKFTAEFKSGVTADVIE